MPAMPAASLDKWMLHEDKTVYVPSNPRFLTPDDLPYGKSFHESGVKEWKENEWGFRQDIRDRGTARQKLISKNRGILESYRARGLDPPPNSTVHIPGFAWLPSDQGWNKEQYQRSMESKQRKREEIARLSKLVDSHHKSAETLLLEHLEAFSGSHDQGMIEAYKFLKTSEKWPLTLWNREAAKFDVQGLEGKSKQAKIKERNEHLHALGFEIKDVLRQKWEAILAQVEAYAHSLKSRCFLGSTLPNIDKDGLMFLSLYLALHKTAIRQVLILLTDKYKHAPGIPGEFATHSLKAQAVLAQLRALKHPPRLGRRRLVQKKGPYLDSDELNKWRQEHAM
jgi:hypothetical protein